MTQEIREFLSLHGASESDARGCELALAEACNNAIKYAKATAREEKIDVDVMCDSKLIELRVNDHTQGFDWPENIELPDADQENGRGLFLINSLMDRVHYYRSPGNNCLVMRKERSVNAASSLEVARQTPDELSRQVIESEKIIRDMAEELSFCYESLSAIFRCSAELGRTNNLEEFASRLLTDLTQITSAEWFVLRLLTRDNQLAVFSASEGLRNLPPLKIFGSEAAVGCMEAEAAITREDAWFDHLSPLTSTDPLHRIQGDTIGLVHPFCLGDTLIGTLTVAKSASTGLFTAVQANVVHTFADFLAIQIVNARYTEDQLSTRLMSRELEIAKAIQRSLLPKSIPSIPGYDLAGFCESAHQVGGDFYDVLKVNDHSLLLIIADVMGKGIPAAMFASILRTLIRAVPEWTSQPATLLSRVNRLLFEELSGVDMFITAQLVYVDSKDRTITAASAGHCPALVCLDRESGVKSLSPDGLPLGILPDTSFSPVSEKLSRNSRLLLYTDGLTEARNPKGEFFGQDRLVDWLGQTIQKEVTAEDLKAELAGQLNNFQSSTALSDDQTFLIMSE